MAFDPDAYLAEVEAKPAPFDPDAYLAQIDAQPAPFDPDAYLAEVEGGKQSAYGGTVVGALERGIQSGLQSVNTSVAQVLGKLPVVGDSIRRGLLEGAAANEQRLREIPRAQDEGIIRQTVTDVVESVPQAVLPIAAAIATRGASLLPQAAALGAASGATERSSAVDDYLKQQGVDFADAGAIERAYADPELMARARDYGNRRGLAVGALDAATLGVSSKAGGALLRAGRPVAAAGAALGLESLGGGAGEAAAQMATDGRVADWDAVRREAMGEILPGGIEVGAAVLGQRAAGPGANIVQMPAMTPEYLARQQQLSNAGAAPGSVPPAAGQPTASSPAGAAPAPFDPDAYLAQVNATVPQPPAPTVQQGDPAAFDPDAYLAQVNESQPNVSRSPANVSSSPASAPPIAPGPTPPRFSTTVGGGYNQAEAPPRPGAIPPAAPGPLARPQLPPSAGVNQVTFPMPAPEVLGMFRELGGNIPKVFRQLAGGRAAGLYRPRDGQGGGGDIRIAADTASLLSPQEVADLQVQADQAVQAVEAQRAQAGLPPLDAPARAAAVEQEHQALIGTAREWARVNRGQEQFAKVLTHEIGHWVDDIPPRGITTRGNLFSRIGHMGREFKQTMPATMSNGAIPFTDKDRRAIRRQAESAVGKAPKDPAARAAWSQQVSNTYATMIETEASRRGLVMMKDVVGETDPLIAWWYGQPAITDYQKQSAERYANLFSIFMMAPGKFAAMAPKTYELMNNWVEATPEYAATYRKWQDVMRSGEYVTRRGKALGDMFRRSEQRLADRAAARAKRAAREWGDSAVVAFDRIRGPIYRRLRTVGEVAPSRAEAVMGAVKDDLYVASEQADVVAGMQQFLKGEVLGKDLVYEDLGKYLFLRRVATERAEKLNPLGFDSKTALEELQGMQQRLGPDRWAALEEAGRGFQRLHQQEVERYAAAGMERPELIDYMRKNDNYATFDVVFPDAEAAVGTIDDMMLTGRPAGGSGAGSPVRRQVGTLQDIGDPIRATLQKHLEMRTAAARNRAKRETARLMMDFFPEEVRPAKVIFSDGRQNVQTLEGERVGTIAWRENGRPVGVHVPSAVAAAFKPQAGGAIAQALRGLSVVSSTFQALHTAWNPAFWPVAFMRDVMGTVSRTPGMSLWIGDKAFVKKLGAGWRAARSLHFGQANPDARRALSRNMLQGVQNYGLANDVDAGIDQIMRRFGQDPVLSRSNSRGLINWLERQGQTFEHAVKIAGMLWTDQNMPGLTEDQKRTLVRRNIGSPEFQERGSASPLLNFLSPFFNAAKEGLRADLTAGRAFESKTQYALKVAAYAILPRIAAHVASKAVWYAAAAAILADGEDPDDEFKAAMASIPERDRLNYMVIPLGWYDRGQRKVMYLRIPQGELQTAIGGMFESALFSPNDKPGFSDVLAFLSSRYSTGSNSLLELGGKWAGLLINGDPGNDSFTDKPILPEQIQKAGGLDAWAAMGKYSYNQLPETFRMVGSVLPGVPARFDLTARPEEKRGLMESLAAAPGVSRFLRISNAGVYEIAREGQAKAEQTRARELLRLREAAARAAEGKDLTKTQQQLINASKDNAAYFREQALGFAKKAVDPVGAMMDASTSRRAQQAARERLAAQGIR